MKHRTVYAVTLFTFVLALSYSTQAAPPDRRDSSVTPSISLDATFGTGVDVEGEMSWGYRCFGIRHGRILGCNLLFHNLETVQKTVDLGIKTKDCDIDATGHVVADTCASGGHKHATSTSSAFDRPQTRVYESGNTALIVAQDPNTQAMMEADFLDSDDEPLGVAGFMPATGDGWRVVKYPTPDAAGSFYWEARLQPPPCYFLAFLCGFRSGPGAQENGEYLWDGAVNVGFEDLVRLPDNLTLYAKARGNTPNDTDDERHVDNVAFAGTARTITAISLISFVYEATTPNRPRLRINDVSLPFGGLFDVRGEYKYKPGGHRSHRDGQDVDLNRTVLRSDNTVSPDIECENDKDLFFVVNQVLAPVPGRIPRNMNKITGIGGTLPPIATALLCERSNTTTPEIFGRKHIDITQIIFPPFNP